MFIHYIYTAHFFFLYGTTPYTRTLPEQALVANKTANVWLILRIIIYLIRLHILAHKGVRNLTLKA